MKKFVSMLLALVMVFALCACGSKTEDGDKAESIKVYKVNVGFYFDDILLSHLIASGILYNGNTAVKLI